jgi:hypothetical protein
MAKRHLIGLLLAAEDDWPTAFEAVLERLGPVSYRGERHEFAVERLIHEPFDLRARADYALVIDRLSWWYHVPREWLKKIALMEEVYLLNNPFTFQAMEKHSAYCAMIRLGLRVPETWLVPHKLPPEDPRWERLQERYYGEFELDEIAERVGYPLFMKPFDGGGWVGVTRIETPEQLHASYDVSGARLMHLQASVEGYDVFTRTLSIGPQSLVVHFDPRREYYDRYVFARDFVATDLEWELVTLSRLVNAFFRGEFNSCEVIVKDGVTYPIDYANAAPDIAITSLHYFFPWAIRALVSWCVFCCVTGRRMEMHQHTREYFEIGDDASLSYEEKLRRYRALADDYFEADAFEEFRTTALARLHDAVAGYIASAEFDDLLVRVVRSSEPDELHERLIAGCRERTQAWVEEHGTP